MVRNNSSNSSSSKNPIFRRGGNTNGGVGNATNNTTTAKTRNAEDDINDNNNNNMNNKDENENYFYIVDMDLTSQGEMVDEVSHLSDPTNYYLTTPTNSNDNDDNFDFDHQENNKKNTNTTTRLQSSNKRPTAVATESFMSPGSGRRRLSASSILKKPIVAIRNLRGGNNTNTVISHDKTKHHNNKKQHGRVGNSKVSPIDEEEGEEVMIAEELLPLTMVVTSGNAIYHGSNNDNIGGRYKSFSTTNNHNFSGTSTGDVEARNPNNNTNHKKNHHRNSAPGINTTRRSSLPRLGGGRSSSSPVLYTNPILSWEDDNLLLFEDGIIPTPRNNTTNSNGVNTAYNTTQQKNGTTRTATAYSPIVPSTATSNIKDDNQVKMTASSSWWLAWRPWFSKQGSCIANGGDDDHRHPQQETTKVSMIRKNNSDYCGFCCCSYKWTMYMLINQWWGWFVVTISIGIWMIVTMTTTSTSSSSLSNAATTLIDLLYWAMISLTTIGPISMVSSFGDDTNDDHHHQPIPLLIGTMIYGILGMTTLGIVWGKYAQQLVQKTMKMQQQQQLYLQEEVWNVFCNHNNNSNSEAFVTTLKTNQIRNEPSSWLQRFPLGRTTKQGSWFVPAVVLLLILTVAMGITSGWTVAETFYYVVITSCTLGDETITPHTWQSKAMALMFIPSSLAMMFRYVATIANMISLQQQQKQGRPPIGSYPSTKLAKEDDGDIETGLCIQRQLESSLSSECNKNSFTESDVKNLLEKAKVEDGLLTRADYLEMMLLAMNKVDPDLLMKLRRGFDQVTQSGSIDLTRKEWIDAAAKAVVTTTKKRGANTRR